MAMRMTGMMSGMDTESIIQELVAVRQKKVDAKKKEQIRIDWKQEAWKELNTKLKNLQTKFISNMRFSNSYSKKVTKISDSTKVSVITGEDAVNGVQSLKIRKLAKTGYLTGAQIKKEDVKGELTALSKLGDIRGGIGAGNEGTFTVKSAKGTVDIKVTDDTMISDILTQIKSAGLNASFDAKWGRFNISSPESGAANDFSITASDENGAKALSALGLQTDIGPGKGQDNATYEEYKLFAQYDATAVLTVAKMKQDDINSRVDSYLNEYKSLQNTLGTINKKYTDLGETLGASADYEKAVKDAADEIDAYQKAHSETEPDYNDKMKKLHEKSEAAKAKLEDARTVENAQKRLDEIAGADGYVTVTKSGDTYSAAATSKLTDEINKRYNDKADYAKTIIDKDGNVISQATGTVATKVSGQDAVIELNGATYENSNNSFEINGLTFTALSETQGEETVTVTTEQDTDGIYDMVKKFLKEYNEIVNQMDKLYNADRAKGYEPLTDEEKDAMSEKEVEKWETKIKDSILRRDDNLSTVNSALQSIMAGGIEVNGKTMYLYDFGIETLGYFNAADNEKHAYHIDGDPDDEFTSGNSDKLKTMIANDPDTVISFFTKLSSNLYDKMFDMSKSVDGYRSFGNFYDDKKMKSDYDSYTSKIKDMETKLAEYEDKWYRKFSKMETALAKMQSNMSAVSSLLGG